MIDPFHGEVGTCDECGDEIELWDECCPGAAFVPYEYDEEFEFWEDYE